MLASSCLRLRISFWWSSVRSLSCSSRRSHLNTQTGGKQARESLRHNWLKTKETHAGVSRNRPWRHLTTWHLTELMTWPDKIRTCLLICWSNQPIRERQQDETGQLEVVSRKRGLYTAVYFGRQMHVRTTLGKNRYGKCPLYTFASVCF